MSSAGFVTGMYVVLTPLIAFACFHARIGRVPGPASRSRRRGWRCSPGSTRLARAATCSCSAGAAVYSLQIVLMERYAPRYDALGFTLVEMLVAFAVLAVAAVADARGAARLDGLGRAARHRHLRERARVPGQTWAQRRTTATRTALVFTLEPVLAALFGFWLAGDRLAQRLGRLAGDHGRHRRSPAARPRRTAPAQSERDMTAVLLALAAAASFGGMTVAIRLAARRRRGARPARDVLVT